MWLMATVSHTVGQNCLAAHLKNCLNIERLHGKFLLLIIPLTPGGTIS